MEETTNKNLESDLKYGILTAIKLAGEAHLEKEYKPDIVILDDVRSSEAAYAKLREAGVKEKIRKFGLRPEDGQISFSENTGDHYWKHENNPVVQYKVTTPSFEIGVVMNTSLSNDEVLRYYKTAVSVFVKSISEQSFDVDSVVKETLKDICSSSGLAEQVVKYGDHPWKLLQDRSNPYVESKSFRFYPPMVDVLVGSDGLIATHPIDELQDGRIFEAILMQREKNYFATGRENDQLVDVIDACKGEIAKLGNKLPIIKTQDMTEGKGGIPR